MEIQKATQFLRDEHKRVTGLFRQMEGENARAIEEMKRPVLMQICMELETHAIIEEEIFYPALAKAANPHASELVERSKQDHAEVKALVQRLRGMDPSQDGFEGIFSDLVAQVELHVAEEEKEVLPMAERYLVNDITHIAERLRARKEELVAQPRYDGARPEEVQGMDGGEQMRKSA
jgi:iron-sulfur cluster repair protein YtfE (RIC family)